MRGERIDIKREATMSEEPPFYAVNLKILLKIGEKYIQEGDYTKTLETRKKGKKNNILNFSILLISS